MRLPTFRTINFVDNVISRFQDNVGVVLQALSNMELLDYVLVNNITVSSTADASVVHGLGRPARGYIVVKSSAATSVYTSSADTGTSKTTLLLRGSATATVSLLVF